MHRVAFLLDEVFAILHELLQRQHGVVIDVELVVGRPRFHGNQHDPGVELLPEDLGKVRKENSKLSFESRKSPWRDTEGSIESDRRASYSSTSVCYHDAAAQSI